MTSFTVLRNFTSIALTACCAIGVSSARAQYYTITDLGVLSDQKSSVSTPAAINDQGNAGTSGEAVFSISTTKPWRCWRICKYINRGLVELIGQVVGFNL